MQKKKPLTFNLMITDLLYKQYLYVVLNLQSMRRCSRMQVQLDRKTMSSLPLLSCFSTVKLSCTFKHSLHSVSMRIMSKSHRKGQSIMRNLRFSLDSFIHYFYNSNHKFPEVKVTSHVAYFVLQFLICFGNHLPDTQLKLVNVPAID